MIWKKKTNRKKENWLEKQMNWSSIICAKGLIETVIIIPENSRDAYDAQYIRQSQGLSVCFVVGDLRVTFSATWSRAKRWMGLYARLPGRPACQARKKKKRYGYILT